MMDEEFLELTTLEKEALTLLVDEWLTTLDTEKLWWDGTWCSEQTMAKKYLVRFVHWLDDRQDNASR